MKPLQMLAVLATLIVCLAGVSWLARTKPASKSAANLNAPANESDEHLHDDDKEDATDYHKNNPFQLNTSGEQPRAELVETTYDFGRLGLGKTGQHDFVLKNVGTVPLKIARGPSQCKCTVTGLKDQEIAPGGQALIHLTWEPKTEGPFAQQATIWTNDPDHPKLDIGVEGSMFREISVLPREGWKLENITNSEPTPFKGLIASSIFEKFEITNIDTGNELIKVEAVPMTQAELEEGTFLSGYLLQGELAGLSEPVRIESIVSITTDLEDYSSFEIPLTANRVGALTVIGPNWFAGGPRLNLGKISAAEGKEFKLTVMIPPGEEEFRFTEVTSNPGFVQFRLQPEKTGKELSRERYSLYVTVPPGSPKGVWGPGREGEAVWKTNSPMIPEMVVTLHLEVE